MYDVSSYAYNYGDWYKSCISVFSNDINIKHWTSSLVNMGLPNLIIHVYLKHFTIARIYDCV